MRILTAVNENLNKGEAMQSAIEDLKGSYRTGALDLYLSVPFDIQINARAGEFPFRLQLEGSINDLGVAVRSEGHLVSSSPSNHQDIDPNATEAYVSTDWILNRLFDIGEGPRPEFS